MKYRIIKKADKNNCYYMIQYKFLFWWKNKKFYTDCMHSYSNGYTLDKKYFKFKSYEIAKEILFNYKKIRYRKFLIKPFIDKENNKINYIIYNKHKSIFAININIDTIKNKIDKYYNDKQIKNQIIVIEEFNL